MQLAEELGMLIYKALDWGIESHLERDLSESLEKLIRFLVKIDTETTKTAVTFQDVIKVAFSLLIFFHNFTYIIRVIVYHCAENGQFEGYVEK